MLTPERIISTVAALLTLAGVVSGILALTRPTRRTTLIALSAGLSGLVVGILIVTTADGGPGTGNGVIAGWAAVVCGLIATALGTLTLIRSRVTQH